MTKIGKFQTALHWVFPSRCVACGTLVESDFGLCSACWAQTSFLGGTLCDYCGVPVLGEETNDTVSCDDCHTIQRPWLMGRSALAYEGVARKLVLALKHGDRQDIAKPAARWMANAAVPLTSNGALVVPVPMHWSRLLKRRYNQASLLGHHMARLLDLPFCPDALIRPRVAGSTEGLTTVERFQKLEGAIEPHKKRGTRMAGRRVILVDDVMTSGATLSSAAQACVAAGANEVCVITLARVAKDAQIPDKCGNIRKCVMTTVEIYTSPLCGFCHAAKRLLTQKGVEFSEVDVLADPNRKPEMIQRANGGRTVPQIFVGDIHVGGCDDLYALDRAGKLDALLGA